MDTELKHDDLKTAEAVTKSLRDKLTRVKAYLPKGFATKVSEQLNCGRGAVYSTFNGRTDNRDVLMALIEMGTTEKERVLNALNQ
jgi:hypothetical protein